MKLYYLKFYDSLQSSSEIKPAFVVASNEFMASDMLRETEVGSVVEIEEVTVLAQAWDPSSNLPLLILPEI